MSSDRLHLSRSSATLKVSITPASPQLRFTQPLKDSYECPTCNKVLQIQTCDDKERGYLFGCKYVQCAHESTPYEDWPKKFQWVTEWYWATGDDDDDQEPAASKYLDPDNIAVYHLGECTFQGCRWTKLHRDCKRRLCNFHCRATGDCSVACHRADGTTSVSPPVSRSSNPSAPSTPSTTSKPLTPSSSTDLTSSASTTHVSGQRLPVTPSVPIRTKATSNAPFDPRPVDPHAQHSKKKREKKAQVVSIKRRRLGVIDLTPGSSRDNPIDLDAE